MPNWWGAPRCRPAAATRRGIRRHDRADAVRRRRRRRRQPALRRGDVCADPQNPSRPPPGSASSRRPAPRCWPAPTPSSSRAPGSRRRGCDGVLPADAAAALASIRPGTRLVSICTGAFVLAAAGLLDGRRAATHWKFADDLRALHPAVLVDENVLFVDDGDILTSAGLAAGIDLCLHIIRADHGIPGRQCGGPLLRGAAVAGGRPGAVHRPAAARRGRRVDRPPPARGRCIISTSR